MSSARKKVIVRQLDGKLHSGYLPVTAISAGDLVELLLTDGHGLNLSLSSLKHVSYVRDFNFSDQDDPERLGLRRFPSKPRGGGLWVRLQFSDDDTLEGLVHSGLPFLDSLLLERGIFLEPPERNGNTQRLFVPRSSLTGFEILGVAGSSAGGRRVLPSSLQLQGALFDVSAED